MQSKVEIIKKNREFIITILIILLAVLARTIPGPRTIDDSYITFRYARNILAGEGFVYNPGEKVLGTTTPLYTGLMAFIGLFFGGKTAPFPTIAMILNAAADTITCLLILGIGKHLKTNWAGFAAALAWALHPFSVTFAIGGLETSFYVLLLTSTIVSYLKKQYLPTAFLGALCLLTRPDALIFLGPLILDRITNSIQFKSRRTPTYPLKFTEILAFTLPVLGWLLFSTAYFGSPIPHSIAAKSSAYQLSQDAAFVRLFQHFSLPFMGDKIFGVPWIGVGMILYPVLFILGALQAIRTDPRLWPWIAYPWVYFAVFAYANPLIFRWYLTPPMPPYQLMIFIGAVRIITDLTTVKKKKRPNARVYTPIVLTLLIIFFPGVLLLSNWRLTPDHGLSNPAPEMAWYKLELLYEKAAKALEPEIRQSSTPPLLAAGDIGALGYFTSAHILDTLGLISPEAVPYYPTQLEYYVNAYAVSPDLIYDFQPDYVVLLEVYGRAGLFKDLRFTNSYVLREKLPTDIYESDGMLIFENKAHKEG